MNHRINPWFMLAVNSLKKMFLTHVIVCTNTQFVVDGIWRVSPDYETVVSGSHINNIVLPLYFEYYGGHNASVVTDLDWARLYPMNKDPTGAWVLPTFIPGTVWKNQIEFKVEERAI